MSIPLAMLIAWNNEVVEKENIAMVKCTYKHEFPVDEWGRPGGFYSLADVPVVRHTELERDGHVVARDTRKELYEVEDPEMGRKFVVPFSKVTLLEPIN